MNRQALWSIGLIGGAILLAALLIILRPEPEAVERTDVVPLVETVDFKAATVPIPVIASGTVEPSEEVVIAPQVTGKISYVNPAFREGGVVLAGATLVQIEADDFRNQVRIAQADVAAQELSVLQAREEVDIARDELDRFSDRETTSSGAKDKINGGNDASRILPPPSGDATIQSSERRQSVEPRKANSLATREPQLRAAEAARERAAANLAVARTSLGRTRAVAPFRGLVREENASVGTIVQPGQALGSIVSASAHEIRLSLTQDEMALLPDLMQRGSRNVPASVFYEYGGQTYRWNATVDRVDAILDANTRNVEVFLRVPAPLTGGKLVGEEGASASSGPPLLLSAFVTAEINGTSKDSYAIVPSTALRPGNEVWLVRDGKLKIVPVRVLQRTDDSAFVTTPELAKGGLLVTSNLTSAIDGLAVRVASKKAQ
ncbi:MAG: HlyD family efflux transporter periplasmic adaptor subunit [Erythrobacter sp.]